MLIPTVTKLPKQCSTQSLISQLSKYRSNNLIQKCICYIQELQSELERQRKINQQQKYLINILQESKEYYEKQCKNNCFEQECLRLRQQSNRLATLAGAHKKANHEMKEKYHELQERFGEKQVQLRQREEAFYQLKLEKELLEKQWNKVVKAVKRKIIKIESQKENPQAQRKIADKNHNSVRQLEKKPSFQKQFANQSLISRAKNMIKHIQQQQAVYQLQNIFLSQSSNKKSSQKSKIEHSAIKTRKPLAELKENIDLPFEVSFY